MQRRTPLAVLLVIVVSQYEACRNFDSDRSSLTSDEQAGTMGYSGADGGSGTHETISSAGNDAGQSGSAVGGRSDESPMGGRGSVGNEIPSGGAPEATDFGGRDGNFGGAEEVLVPRCILGSGATPIEFTTPSALSVNLLQGGVPYEIFATQPTTNLMTYRWYDTHSATWLPWECFDLVPHPARVAATNLSNSLPEVYVTTQSGSMFVRRFYSLDIGWGEWEPLQLPTASSHVSDVAVVGPPSRILFLYVVDRGALFVRHRVDADAFSAYAPWHRLDAPFQAKRICSAVEVDQIQNIAALSADGTVLVSKQETTAPDAAFSAFEPLAGSSQMTFDELQCGYLADGTIVLFGLAEGAVWSRALGASNNWIKESGNPPYIQTFAVGSEAGSNSTVVGADANNTIWSHLERSENWNPIEPQ